GAWGRALCCGGNAPCLGLRSRELDHEGAARRLADVEEPRGRRRAARPGERDRGVVRRGRPGRAVGHGPRPVVAWVLRALGVLAILIGTVWMLQGIGTLPGSFMTGQMFWFWMGLLCAGVGFVLIVVSTRGRRA